MQLEYTAFSLCRLSSSAELTAFESSGIALMIFSNTF